MVVYFNTLSDYEAKNTEITVASNWESGTTRYADESPLPKANGKYEMPVIDGFEQFFEGLQIVEPIPEINILHTPTYSAEDWTSQHFTAPQILALQRFEFALQQAGKPLGPNMAALKQWLETMLLASVDPTPRSDWSQPPCGYAVAAGEAVATLQN